MTRLIFLLTHIAILARAVVSESTLHHLYPNSIDSYETILQQTRDFDWDVWYSSRYVEDGTRIRGVEGQTSSSPVHVEGGRIDVYDSGSTGFRTSDSFLSLRALLKDHTTSAISTSPSPQPPAFTFSETDTPANSTFHNAYHTLPQIIQFVTSLAHTYPDLMSVKRIGLSAEGRDLLAVEINKPDVDERKRTKKGFVIGGAQHAREWIATSTVLHIIHSLVHPDGSLNSLLDHFNFYIVPIPNPDGYVWTWEGDRFWYKNRQTLGPNIKCVGVDTNRNWGYKWKPRADSYDIDSDDVEEEEDVFSWNEEYEVPDQVGEEHTFMVEDDDAEYIMDEDDDDDDDDEVDEEIVNEDDEGTDWYFSDSEEEEYTIHPREDAPALVSNETLLFPESVDDYLTKPKRPATDPCSHWFPGTRKWQAPEVNNYANYVSTLPNLISFLDLRSYGQMVSTPYSFSCSKTAKDAEDLVEAALGGTSAMKRSGGVWYATGTLCDQLYPAPGNIIDWMYQIRGIKFSYSVHLRDTGTYGFALPPEYIQPVSHEMEEMVKSLSEFILLRT